MEIEKILDKTLEGFFPQDGRWSSNCYEKSDFVSKENLPCHLRDNNWLARLILKEYNLYYLGKDTILDYIINSSNFNKLRNEYEQKIVSWQIEWMYNGRGNWVVDEKSEGEFYLFNTKCDYIFRKGIVNTLLAIGINIDAIEEGIEKNACKWRENLMRRAFYNLYSVSKFTPAAMEEEPSQEHLKKWMKLRLYEYYIEHKDSVDKYGEILPEMQMTELELEELKKWLEEAHEKRTKQISEYKNNDYSLKIPEIDYFNCDFPSVNELEKDENTVKSNKIKSLIKELFKK